MTSPGPPSTVLLTGAAGFIGSHLAQRLLADGHAVVGLDNFCDYYDPALKRRNLAAHGADPRFTLLEADIRDAAALDAAFRAHRPGVVVHLAAMAGVRPSIDRPAHYAAVNVEGTARLLDAAVRHGAGRFLFASSSSVYGQNSRVPFAEDDRVDHPISPYAATKRAGELLCHACWHLHRLPVFCLRLFTVYGPRQRPDLAIHKFLELVARDQPVPMFGDGSSSRDYTYVDDIVSGIRAAMARCDTYRVYNLGGDHPVSLKQLLNTIEMVTGRTVRTVSQPDQPGDVPRTWADLTRSRAELGYQPRTPLADGIARQWQWLQAEKRGLTPFPGNGV